MKKEEYSNVISEREFQRESNRALAMESRVFANTLGPFGMHTVIEDRNLAHSITKDGFTVYQDLVIYNRVGRVTSRLIQKISGSLNEVVGDGTTSAVIVANELKSIRKLIKKYKVPPKVISDIMSTLSKYLVEKIGEYSIQFPFSEDGSKLLEGTDKFNECKMLVKKLASISLNNDYNRGALVSEIFMHLSDPRNGFINVEASKTNTTYFDKDRGFEIYRGMIVPEMCTEPDGKTAIYSNPVILLINGSLLSEDSDSLNKVIQVACGKMDRPLVIIAGGFSKAVTETMRQSIIAYGEKNAKKLPVLCVEIDTESQAGKSELLDIEANIGGRILTIDPNKTFPSFDDISAYVPYFGYADKITVTMAKTRILGGHINREKANFRIKEIDDELEHMKSEQHVDHRSDVFKLNRRKALLNNDMMSLYIGGDTIEEKESNADLFDDAVRGCKSAVRCGIVPGGNTVVGKICYRELDDNEGAAATLYVAEHLESAKLIMDKLEDIVHDMLEIIMVAYRNSYAIVLNNKYRNIWKSKRIADECIAENKTLNLITEKFEDFREEHIVDGVSHVNKDAFVINSADIDTRILIAATSIIDLIITSNQFLRIPEMKQMQKNM